MPLFLLSGHLPAFLQPLQAHSGPQIAQRSLPNAHLHTLFLCCCTCICSGSSFAKPNLSKYLHVLICSRTADCVPQIFYHRMSAALNANNTQPLKEKMSYAVHNPETCSRPPFLFILNILLFIAPYKNPSGLTRAQSRLKN